MITTKRIIALLLAAVLLLQPLPIGVHADDSGTLTISSAENIRHGDTVPVSINITQGVNASMFQFALAYDADKLELVDAHAGDLFSGMEPPTLNGQIVGSVYMNWDSISNTISKGGSLLDLTFKVKPEAEGNAKIWVDLDEEYLFCDYDFNDVAPKIENGSIAIKEKVLVSSVAVQLPKDTINVGEQITAAALIQPENADDPGVVWSISNGAEFASVDESGLVTGTAEGQAILRATALDGGGAYGEVVLQIQETAPDDAVPIDAATFPDAAFRKYVCETIAGNRTYLTRNAIANVTEIDCSAMDIASFQGIEIFSELTRLICRDNKLTTLDVSGNSKLVTLYCSKNKISRIDLKSNTELKYVDLSSNLLDSLDVSGNSKLIELSCAGNNLDVLDISGNPELVSLNCNNNHIKVLDLHANDKLYSYLSANVPGTMMLDQNCTLVADELDGSYIVDLGSVIGPGMLKNVRTVNGGSYDANTGCVTVNGSDKMTYELLLRVYGGMKSVVLRVEAAVQPSGWVYVREVPSTCLERGHSAYWYHAQTDTYTMDQKHEQPISQDSTILPLAAHTPRDGICIYCSIPCGDFGENMQWSLSENMTLRITGSGDMPSCRETPSPWAQMNGQIQAVFIGEGITSIGSNAFADCACVKSVRLPEQLKSIGAYAFANCVELTEINLPEALKTMGAGCFEGCTSLRLIDLSQIPDEISQWQTTLDDKVRMPACLSKANVTWEIVVLDGAENCAEVSHDSEGRSFLLMESPGKICLVCKDSSTGAQESKIIELKAGVVITTEDQAVLVGGGKIKLSALRMPEATQVKVKWSLTEDSKGYASITSAGVLTTKAVDAVQDVTVIAAPIDGSAAAKRTFKILPLAKKLSLKLDGKDAPNEKIIDLYDGAKTLKFDAEVTPEGVSTEVIWTSSNTKVAAVNKDGMVSALAVGTAVIKAIAADGSKVGAQIVLDVIITDHSPRLGASTLNLNTALEAGVSVDLVESYGNDIQSVSVDDDRFAVVYEDNVLTLTVAEGKTVNKGTYKMNLSVSCTDAGGNCNYPLTVKVSQTLPKLTVKQIQKFNLFYEDSKAELTFSGGEIENAEIDENGDFTLKNEDGKWNVCYAEGHAFKPSTKATLRVLFAGCTTPVTKVITIATVNTAPKISLNPKTSVLNTALTNDWTVQAQLLGTDAEDLSVYTDTEGADVSITGSTLIIKLDKAKAVTVNVYLQADNWAQPLKLTHKITVSNKTPTLKPAGSLTLSSLFTARTAETAMVLSQSNLTLVDVEAAPTAKAGTSALAESEKLRVAYDPETGHMVAAIRDPGNAPKAGTYSFTCTGTLEDGTQIPGGTLRVTVSAAAPKIKLSATSVKLNQYLAGEEQGRVRVTAPSGYQVADFTGKPEGMSFDGDTGMLTVTLEDASHRGGTYTLCPVVRDMETGEEVTLPTKLSFQVRAYNSKKLSVSLSAKGKLNTQTDGEIAYTVTKLTNCLGTVENVDLVGQDGDLFQADMDIVNGKPTVHLTLVSGSTYATNKAYKIQLRFYACGKEILSPVQTVKVTQTALKVTSPKTVTYYQAQKAPLRVALTTNLPMDTVALNSKTAKEFQSALGEVTLNGNRVEFEIANPAALTAGKSYAVVLDATPENNAKNGKPVTVKLTVKVRK